MKERKKFRVINVNQNNEEIDISKITIPENHPFYDVLRNLEGKYARNYRQDTAKKKSS